MQEWTASDAKNRLGQAIEAALVEPVALTKQGRPVVVMLSVSEYRRLVTADEDALRLRAIESEKSGYLSAQETSKLLDVLIGK